MKAKNTLNTKATLWTPTLKREDVEHKQLLSAIEGDYKMRLVEAHAQYKAAIRMAGLELKRELKDAKLERNHSIYDEKRIHGEQVKKIKAREVAKPAKGKTGNSKKTKSKKGSKVA